MKKWITTCLVFSMVLSLPINVKAFATTGTTVETTPSSRTTEESIQRETTPSAGGPEDSEATVKSASTASLTPSNDASTLPSQEAVIDEDTLDTIAQKDLEPPTVVSEAIPQALTDPTSDPPGTTAKNPWIVHNQGELEAALNDESRPAYIQIGPQETYFDLTKGIELTYSVTIDGNGQRIGYDHGNGIRDTFHVTSSGIDVTFKNITFGSPDYTVPAANYYGFFHSRDNADGVLRLENINYYSKYRAQMLHTNPMSVEFDGKNDIVVSGGTSSQEWLEAKSLTFKAKSQTRVYHDTTNSDGFIFVSSGSQLDVVMEAGAVFDVTTDHHVVWGANAVNMLIGEEAKLLIKAIPGRLNNPQLFYGTVNWQLDTGPKAEINIAAHGQSTLNAASRLNINQDVQVTFNMTGSAVTSFNRSQALLSINQAQSVKFSRNGANRNNVPMGMNIAFDDHLYGINLTDTSLAYTTNQELAETWVTEDRSIQRTNSFTDEELAAIVNASALEIVKLPTASPTAEAQVTEVGDNYLTAALSNLTEGYRFESAEFRLYRDDGQQVDPTTEALTVETITDLQTPVTFQDLSPDTSYVIAVKVTCCNHLTTEWLALTEQTEPALLDVSFPVTMIFDSQTDFATGITQISSEPATISNQSNFPVLIDAGAAVADQQIGLMVEQDQTNQQAMWLELRTNEETSVPLFENMGFMTLTTLAENEETAIYLAGEYYGPTTKKQAVKHQFTLRATLAP